MERSSAAIIRDGRAEPLEVFEDFFASAPLEQTESRIEAPAVFVGYGIKAPAFQYDDYEGVDVTGKIAVMLWGAPPSINGDPGAHYSSPAVKAIQAGERGAIGMVVIPTDALLRIVPWDLLAAVNRQP